MTNSSIFPVLPAVVDITNYRMKSYAAESALPPSDMPSKIFTKINYYTRPMLNSSQSHTAAYRKNRSTETALLRVCYLLT